MTRTKRGGFRGGAGGAFKKGGTNKRAPAAASDDEGSPPASKKPKSGNDKKAAPIVTELLQDDVGDSYIKLNHNGMRRVTVGMFRGTPIIHIREFYVNDGGETKPGKKGISLSVDQYTALLNAIPLLEQALADKGVEVPRPDYEADLAAASAVKDQDQEEEEKAEEDADEDPAGPIGKTEGDDDDD